MMKFKIFIAAKIQLLKSFFKKVEQTNAGTPIYIADDFAQFELTEDAEGYKHAFSKFANVTIVPDGVTSCKEISLMSKKAKREKRRFFRLLKEKKVSYSGAMFHRVANEFNLKHGFFTRKKCLVCQLDGVRVYIKKGNIIITKQDLYL